MQPWNTLGENRWRAQDDEREMEIELWRDISA